MKNNILGSENKILSENKPWRLLGKLKTKRSLDIPSSRFSVGFECLDRRMFNPDRVYPRLARLGAKWARVQTGWARCEKEKGKYDFTWLDKIVDSLLAIGIQPWFNVTYGNRVYSPDAPHELAMGWPPVYTETGRKGWSNFCRALAKHYKNRVKYYEIWNEPDTGGPKGGGYWASRKGSPKYYTLLVRLASEAIRGVFPRAKIIGGAFSSVMGNCGFVDKCFRLGIADSIDILSYHLYSYHPEGWIDRQLPALRKLVRQYAPDLGLWQGESGAVSRSGKNQEMGNFSWDPKKQAKHLLRRTLLELAQDTELISYFHASDFMFYIVSDHVRHERSYYGLVGGNDYKPKPAFYALQSICALFSGNVKRIDIHMHLWPWEKEAEPLADTARLYAFQAGKNMLLTVWYPRFLRDKHIPRKVLLNAWTPWHVFKNPVVIDPITQKVYQIEPRKQFRLETVVFNEFELPLWDYPLIIADRKAVSLA